MRELLLESGGNIRRFLQASFVVFENSPPGPGITRDIVRKALKTTGGAWAPGEKAVRRAVTDALQRVPGDIRVDHDVDGQRIDYAVTQGNSLILAVTISQALFGQDEAIKAVRQIEAIQALRRHLPTVVLVVVGYTSPDVREILQEVGRVVVANGPDFAVELNEALLGAVSGSEAFVPAVFEERLTELRDELVRLIAQRGTEEQLVSTTLQRSYAERSAVEWNEEVRRFRVLWMTERQRIEEAINDRRSKKRRDDAAELIAVHDEFIRLRRSRLRVFIGLALLVFSSSWVAILSLVEETSLNSSSFVGFFGPPLAFVVVALFYEWLQHQKLPVGALQGIEDVNRAVRQNSWPTLRSQDPFKRYRAILDRANMHESPDELYSMALREPSGIIRRALLKNAIDNDPALLLRAVRSNMEAVDLSAAAETDVMFEDFWTDLPVKLRVITLLSRGSDKDDWRDFDRPKLETWLEWFVAAVLEHNISGSAEQMARAFVTDDDGLLAEALQDVSERDLRRAAATLSPLDDDGIGSYYWLDASDLIRDMYIFFRKALFFLAGGVERSSTPSRA